MQAFWLGFEKRAADDGEDDDRPIHTGNTPPPPMTGVPIRAGEEGPKEESMSQRPYMFSHDDLGQFAFTGLQS